jgi:hypothetical protein
MPSSTSEPFAQRSCRLPICRIGTSRENSRIHSNRMTIVTLPTSNARALISTDRGDVPIPNRKIHNSRVGINNCDSGRKYRRYRRESPDPGRRRRLSFTEIYAAVDRSFQSLAHCEKWDCRPRRGWRQISQPPRVEIGANTAKKRVEAEDKGSGSIGSVITELCRCEGERNAMSSPSFRCMKACEFESQCRPSPEPGLNSDPCSSRSWNMNRG